MRGSWDRGWIACAIDSEGSLTLSRANLCRAGHRKKWGTAGGTYVAWISIYNTDLRYIDACAAILRSWGLTIRTRPMSRKPPKKNCKVGYGVFIGGMEQVSILLSMVLPYLVIKKDFAEAILSLCASRMGAVRGVGGNSKMPWSESDVQMAEEIRRKFMPRRKRANGEALLDVGVERVIPSEAKGSAECTLELLESRPTSSTSGNSAHERPASHEDEDVLQSSEKSESRDKAPGEDIAIN